MGLFDERNLFEVTHPDFPNERLVACRNPELAERRRHKRRALLEATCKELEKVCRMVERRRLQGKEDIRAAVKKLLNKYKVGRYYRLDIRDDGFDFELDETTMDADASRLANGNSELANKRLQRWKRHMGTIAKQFEGIRQRIGRGQLHGKDKIGVRVGRVLNKYKVGKHFKLDIRDDSFSFEIDDTKVTAEAALDGIYVIRTSLAEQRMKTDDTVRSYKLLTQVERAFRSFKSMDLKVRPIRHRRENRVRAHVFLCMLAYYVLWHMMEAWRPLLFSDEDQQAKASVTRLLRRSAPRPPCARYKPRSLTMGVELQAASKLDVMHVEHLPHRASRKSTLPPVAIEDGAANGHRELLLVLRLVGVLPMTMHGRKVRTKKLRERRLEHLPLLELGATQTLDQLVSVVPHLQHFDRHRDRDCGESARSPSIMAPHFLLEVTIREQSGLL